MKTTEINDIVSYLLGLLLIDGMKAGGRATSLLRPPVYA
jgi:hypothetical protein